MMDANVDRARHPYLTGNFAPVKRELPLTPCRILEGSVPAELSGGQYVRNGGNPWNNDDEDRQAHWFDGDGMLTGVLFQRTDGDKNSVQPHFINRFILTDVLLTASSVPSLRRPILPSISAFAAPFSLPNLWLLLTHIIRAVLLTLWTFLTPWQRHTPLKRISTANTSIWWHDGQAYAGCESGPPIKILLPGLETASWWTGDSEESEATWSNPYLGPMKLLSEFTTAHPRIDPVTNELLLFHMSFVAPYLRISVIPARDDKCPQRPPLLGVPVTPGISKPKLAHDFCATQKRTILIDMPLTLDPRNLLHGKPMLSYEEDEGKRKTRFGIIPRRRPERVQWYESEACCIYHAANAWDEEVGELSSTHLVACRLNSATLVYAAGNLRVPKHAKVRPGETEKCQLYYWKFADVAACDGDEAWQAPSSPRVECEFALSDIPFEFPSMDDARAQRKNTFVYGATMTRGSFDAGLGAETAKIDCLAKINISRLIARGTQMWEDGTLQAGQAVDARSVTEILASQRQGEKASEEEDPIQLFALPPHHYAQEATFIARADAQREDDGYLVFFVFDESTGLHAHDGSCKPEAKSQLWIVDARSMQRVACRIEVPQRIPYGLHGHFFSEAEIQSQRPVDAEHVRNWASSTQSRRQNRQKVNVLDDVGGGSRGRANVVRSLRNSFERPLARLRTA